MKQPGTYLADILMEDGQIPKEQQSIYAYLFDYLIESLLYDIIVLIFGLLVHRLDITLCYLLVTIPIRHFAGGFHANTRLGCTLLSYGIYLATVFLGPILVPFIKPVWLFILYLIFWGMILPVAPVDTKNKRLSVNQRKKLFHRCIITCIIMSIIMFVLYTCRQVLYMGMITICMMEGVISVYIGIWKNRRNL